MALPKLSEIELMLQMAYDCYSDKPTTAAKIDEQELLLFTSLYNQGKLQPQNIPLLEKLIGSLKEKVDTIKSCSKLCNTIDYFNKLGINVDTGYSGLVSQIVNKYADAVIGTYQKKGLYDELLALLKEIKEVPEDIKSHLSTKVNLFGMATIPEEKIKLFSPLLELEILICLYSDKNIYLVVPGTYSYLYGDNWKRFKKEETIVMEERDTLAKKVVDEIYSRIKQTKISK